MNFFAKLRYASALLFCTVTLGACSVIRAYPLPDQPNFILILSDDQDVASLAHMPNVQKLLVQQGTVFTNMFVTTPLCCPSRASILRGQYAHNHLVQSNEEAYGGFRQFYEGGLESSTLATWLQDAGYKTMFLGKYFNHYPGSTVVRTYVPKGWDEWHAVFKGHYFNYNINHNGKVKSYGSEEQDYETDVLARQASTLLGQPSSQPFFMYLAPFAPHNDAAESSLPSPPTPAPRHARSLGQVSFVKSPSFNEEDVSDKPAFIRTKDKLSDEEIKEIEELYRYRLQSLLAVDEMVASIVATLEDTGQLENTYIIFTSDNGWIEGQHRMFSGKYVPYEESIRVPLVIRGPTLEAGQSRDELVLNIDFAPTLAELAGVQTPSFVDGRSLVPLFSSERPSAWRQAFLSEGWREDSESQTLAPWYLTLRTATQKYTQWLSPKLEIEFYDLTQDPYELESLHETLPDKTKEHFSAWLSALSKCQGEVCRELENQD
jgi:N-acetylglucosamine-6-sulfatase